MKKRGFLIITICILLIFLSSCSSSTSNVIKKFEKSYNTLDINGMLDCIHPTYARAIKGMAGLFGGIADIDAEDLIDVIPLLQFTADKESPKMSIDIKDSSVKGKSAEVKANISYKYDGQKEKDKVVFYLEKVDGEWYIVNVE